jgi:hypothetical protein
MLNHAMIFFFLILGHAENKNELITFFILGWNRCEGSLERFLGNFRIGKNRGSWE